MAQRREGARQSSDCINRRDDLGIPTLAILSESRATLT